jgi:phosphoribosylformimino-5-aminoimidazole carboxamide ribotide isomerase
VIVLPAIDLWNGEVVKLEAKRHRSVETVYGRPGEIADRWLGEGAEWLHVVDLNASIGEGAPNRAALSEILPRARRSGARVQWGGGVRDDRALDQLLEDGVERAIVGTKAIRDWAWLEAAAARRPSRILVSIDGRGREILIQGWQESAGVDAVEFIRRADRLALAGYLYTNVAVEGKGEGVDWAPVKEIVAATKRPVVFSGGVTSLEDVARFKALGAYGIIAGSALYRGRFGLKEAKALAR